MVAQTNYTCAAAFQRNRDTTAIVNGEVMQQHILYIWSHTDLHVHACMSGLQLLACDLLTARVGQQLLFVHI